MDPRRRLIRLTPLAGALFLMGGCALFRPAAPPAPIDPVAASGLAATMTIAEVPEAPDRVDPPPLPDGARPYLDDDATGTAQAAPAVTPHPGPSGRTAIAAANRTARAGSRADGFVGGLQVFAWEPGRVFEIWTAPLRVTLLTLAPGETVTAKAAGDTVRWQIGESVSGSGSAARTHVLIKPLTAGLETNLVVTTNQRVYMLALRSGSTDSFNAAVAWDDGAVSVPGLQEASSAARPPIVSPADLAPVAPRGPLDARYRVEAQGRTPRWTPTAVFNDGVRTFLTLPPEARVDETPALFIVSGGDRQLVNYRQSDGMIIVDRVFDLAELRLGDRRPQIVRVRRLHGATR